MALGFTPAVNIYGANAALLNQRLISWEHIDAAGFESDQLTLTIDLEGLRGCRIWAARLACKSVIEKPQWSIKACSK